MRIQNYQGLIVLLFCLLSTFATAQLHFENFVLNGAGAGAVMDQASAVAISPDGNYVYVTSAGSNAINVFNKNSSSPTGQLTFVQALVSGVEGVQGLTSAQHVTVSPDGNQVYAVGNYDDALVTFNRSHVDGTLTFVSMHKDGLGGVDGLDAPYMVKVSPDGNQVYVSSTDDNAISVFNRNSSSGELTFNTKVTRSGMSTCLGFDISPDGKNIYATANLEGKVVVFSRNENTGALTFVEEIQDNVNFIDGLGGAFSAYVSADGKNVYATGANDNSLIVFDRNQTTGSLTAQSAHTDNQAGVDFLGFPLHVEGSIDGNYIYVLGSSDNAINIFERNTSTGTLTFKEAMVDENTGVSGLQFPVNIAVSPDGDQVYAASNGSGAAVVFSKENSGSLSFVENQMTGTGGVAGLNSPYGVSVSPDGKHVYAAAYGEDALAIFSRNQTNGSLNFVDVIKDDENGVDGLYRVYSVIVSPDGKNVYAVGNNDDALAVFSRDEITGELTFMDKIKDNIAGVDGLNGARFVTVSADGKNVYTAGYYDDAIAVFSRNTSTGDLSFVQFLKDGQNGVDGLNGANCVTVSADGNYVYSTGYVDDAIAVFSRNTSTGELSFIDKYKNGAGNVNGLNGAHSVIVSNDGKSVYACGYNDNAVVSFSRNASTGTLTFVDMYKDGVNGVDGLKGPRAVALNPDGIHLYAVSGGENAIVLFDRNDETSALTFETKHEDGINEVNGLAGARNVTVSPFGRHIYVAGADDDAISIFSCTYVETMTEEICQGGSVTIGNNVYTEPGTYEDVIADTYGCVSKVTLELSVLATSQNISQTICAGEAYEIGGQAFTESGVYQATEMNSEGCEVATTLNLIVTSPNTTTMEAEVCQGEVYQVGSNILYESGTYENVLTSAVTGCDSVVVLNLTVNTTNFNESATICSSEAFVFGSQTLTFSGSYQETFTSTNGCDSIVTLQLAVVNYYSENVSETICDGANYTFGNTTYSTAGTYTNTFTAVTGCDSIVTLNLSVEDNISNLVNETICDGEAFNFGGIEYDETGFYTQNLTSTSGCDSAVTLNLTVLPGIPSELNEVICPGETYYFGGNIYTESGVYTSTFSSPNGCETLVTLTLSVQDVKEVTITETICEGDQYPFGSQLLSQPGTYMGNFVTLGGCDSIVTLILNGNSTQSYTLFETICKGDIYKVGNQEFAYSGTYETTLNSAVTGCDSIVTLNLTVVDVNGGALITNDDGTGTGAINMTISNGTPPYSYEWSNGADTEDVTGLEKGTYSLVVSDANGCSETFVYTIESSSSIFNPNFDANFGATIHPNPVSINGALNLTLTNDKDQMFRIKMFDSVGRMVEEHNVQVGTGEQLFNFEAPNDQGLYFIQITNEKQETKSLKVMVH